MHRSAARRWAWGSSAAALATLVVSVTVAANASGSSVPPSGVRLPAQRIVVLGDSVPAGTGCGCVAFPALLARDARASSAGGTLSDLSVDGLTAERLDGQLAAAPADLRAALARATVVAVTVGANDLDQAAALAACASPGPAGCTGGGIAGTSQRVASVLTRVRALSPHARIVALGYWNAFPSGRVGRSRGAAYVAASEAATQALNAGIRAAARAVGGRYVDLYRAFGEDGAADDADLLADDGDHPSGPGHRVIADAVERSLGWPPPRR